MAAEAGSTDQVYKRIKLVGEKDSEQKCDQSTAGTPREGAHRHKEDDRREHPGSAVVEYRHKCPMVFTGNPVACELSQLLSNAAFGTESKQRTDIAGLLELGVSGNMNDLHAQP